MTAPIIKTVKWLGSQRDAKTSEVIGKKVKPNCISVFFQYLNASGALQ